MVITLNENTTVQVAKKTRDRLKPFGQIGESYDHVLNNLMDMCGTPEVFRDNLLSGHASITTMPKLESPFVRKKIDGAYVVVDEVAPDMDWVFDDSSVLAVEKLHGENVSVFVKNGTILHIWDRTNRIPFFNRGREQVVTAVRNAYSRKYMDFLLNGQHFGECVGYGIHGNKYGLDDVLWVPFTHLAEKYHYESWGKYPKTFDSISDWFKDLESLFASHRGISKVFAEGIVFTHPDGRLAKLRRDMFPWFKGRRH